MELNRYYTLHSYIVHYNGNLECFKNDSAIMQYVDSNAIKSIDTIKEWQVLSPEFCDKVAQTMNEFIQKLCDSVNEPVS